MKTTTTRAKVWFWWSSLLEYICACYLIFVILFCWRSIYSGNHYVQRSFVTNEKCFGIFDWCLIKCHGAFFFLQIMKPCVIQWLFFDTNLNSFHTFSFSHYYFINEIFQAVDKVVCDRCYSAKLRQHCRGWPTGFFPVDGVTLVIWCNVWVCENHRARECVVFLRELNCFRQCSILL